MNSIPDSKNSGQTRLCCSRLFVPLLALWCATIPQLGAQTARLVRAEYLNILSTNAALNGPVANSSSVATFSGHIVQSSTNGIPTNNSGSLVLRESSFGQTFATDLPFPNFVAVTLSNALTYLYPPPNATRAELESGADHWAFRYKWLLYSNDSTAVVLTEAFPESLYGDAERANIATALDLLRKALAYAPYDRNLRHAYLDIFYDQAVAERSGIKSELATIARYRIGEVAVGADEFIIDKEVQSYSNILNKLKFALTNYGQIFTDASGVDVTLLDTNAALGTPFGYFMFQQEQPFRNQMAPQFLNGNTLATLDPQNGVPLAATEQRVLFAGYKDFVMLMTLLQDTATYSAELARLYGIRGTATDRTNAYALIAQTQTEVPAEVSSLTGMFPPTAFPVGDASGARAAINGVLFAMTELENVKAFLDGRANPLGLDPNFLVLIQDAAGLTPSGQNTPFDTFDSLKIWISPSSDTGPLKNALTKYTAAQTAYANYRAKRDKVAEELANVDNAYEARNFAITGTNSAGFTGDNPHAGSELWLSRTTLSNLQGRLIYLQIIGGSLTTNLGYATLTINDAVDRTNQIDNLVQSYFNRTDSAWQEIHDWKTSAAVSQAAAEAAYAAAGAGSEDFGAGAIASLAVGAVNTAIQGAAASRISQREQDLEHASSTHEANLQKLSAYPAALQAQSDFERLIREQTSNNLDIQDVYNQIAQELALQASLQRELDVIRLNRDAARAQNASRYYADPIHAFRAQGSLIAADQAFRTAQRWVFYTQRALEYKWNKDFVQVYDNRSYDKGTIFKLRNADELNDLVSALATFNTFNLGSFSRQESLDRISLVDDLLLPFNGDPGTDDGMRFNDAGVKVPKAELFRSILRGTNSSLRDVVIKNSDTCTIRLDTSRLQKVLGSFFRGPAYSTNATMSCTNNPNLSVGRRLDKIRWVKFNIIRSDPPNDLYPGATMRYSGTCYLRVTRPPCCYDARTPEVLFRSFPFQYFYPNDQISGAFLSQPNQDADVRMVFSSAPWTLASTPLSDVNVENTAFKELSVAASGIELRIPSNDLDDPAKIKLSNVSDIEIWVKHLDAANLPCQ